MDKRTAIGWFHSNGLDLHGYGKLIETNEEGLFRKGI